MAEHLKDKIRARVRGVDLVIGPDGYRRLLEAISQNVTTPRQARMV